MANIFISYRREDSQWEVALIRNQLTEQFGSDAVFTDIDSIPLGVNVRHHIDEQVGQCDVLLAVIGERWLSVTDEAGRPRLKQPRDFVRLEIQSALQRGIPIIPLLIGNTAMPRANQLPKSLRELPDLNGTPIRPPPTFKSDAGRLIRGIEKLLDIQAVAQQPAVVEAVEGDDFADAKQAPGTVFQDTLRDGSKGPEMVLIPAGTFWMGSPEDERDRWEDEGPRHQVTIPCPFALGRTPVTFAEYDRFAEATSRNKPNDEGWGRGSRPVINVSWEDAVAYAEWMSEQTGCSYRLPSEAEWEYACRAGSDTAYCFGDDEEMLDEYAWFWGDAELQTHPVGKKRPNEWGLYDVHGNVWEWVQDCWRGDYDGAPDDGTAWVDQDEDIGLDRVLRGGSWYVCPGYARSALRGRDTPDVRSNSVGFRVLCSSPSLSSDLLDIQAVAQQPAVVEVVEGDEFAEETLAPGTVLQDTLRDGSKGPEMVVLPAGTFWMGSPEDERDRDEDEGPRHEVTIPCPFALGRTPVTFADYDAFAAATGREQPDDDGWGRDNRPVINVNWRDAVAYAEWMSEQTGCSYRLSSEAEWEYACRAGSDAAYCFGDDEEMLDEYAWFYGNAEEQTHPVGKKRPNEWGLYDVHGNVWEWVQDRWHDDYDGAPDDGTAWEDQDEDTCRSRVLRGGSWVNNPVSARSAGRGGYDPGDRDDSVGFRVLCSSPSLFSDH